MYEDSESGSKILQSNLDSYKYCFVPSCKNTSATAPDKEFICVPINEKRRKLWYEAAGCPERMSKSKSNRHCCEDHFDLKEDMRNYMKYKMMGGHKYMKPDAVPRFFPTKDPLATSDENVVYAYAIKDTSEVAVSQESLLPQTIVMDDTSSEADILAQVDTLREIDALSSACSSATFQHNKYSQTEIEVEHVHVQAKPQTYTKNIQTLKEKKSTRSVGVTCHIIT